MIVQVSLAKSSDRIKSIVGVIILHGLLAYVLIAGLNIQQPVSISHTLKIFDVQQESPMPAPKEETAPARVKAESARGKASPPNQKATPSPLVAPPPEIRLAPPPPMIAAPASGMGSDNSGGAVNVAGPGTGGGGAGRGNGSGSEGSGSGGGGGTRARLIKGRILNADYPRAASKANVGGTVIVRFSVGTDGRAHGCTISISSGNADLDMTTCRLVERRFRYEPAKDAQGRPISEIRAWKQTWWLEN